MIINVKAIQVIDGKEEIIEQSGKGTYNNYKNGTVLLWQLKDNEQFKMTILKEKIILEKLNQTIIFELETTTKSVLKTRYGSLNMYITTKEMKILKQQYINKIYLKYDIKIENIEPYENKLQIDILHE